MLGLSTDLRSTHKLATGAVSLQLNFCSKYITWSTVWDPSLMMKLSHEGEVTTLSHKLPHPPQDRGRPGHLSPPTSFLSHTQHALIQHHPCDKPAAQRVGVCVGRCATGECVIVCVCLQRPLLHDSKGSLYERHHIASFGQRRNHAGRPLEILRAEVPRGVCMCLRVRVCQLPFVHCLPHMFRAEVNATRVPCEPRMDMHR
jgi:hypothetical protein